MRRILHFRQGIQSGIVISLLVSATAFCVVTDPATSTTTVPSLLPQVSSVFANSSAGQNLVNVLASCTNFMSPALSVGGALGQMITGKNGMSVMMPVCPMAAQYSVTMQCPGSDQIPQVNLTCDNNPSPAILKQTEQMLTNALCTVQCEKAKSDAVKAEIQCVQTMSQNLTAQIASLNALFTTAAQAAQQQVQVYTQTAADDQVKITQVQTLLTGDQSNGSGSVGLLAEQKTVKDLVASMPNNILQIQQSYNQNVQQQNVINSQMQTLQSTQMMDCFANRPIDTYRCTPSGSPVSASEYLLCRFQQTHTIDSNGILDTNTTVQAQSQSQATALSALLGQIQADSSNKLINSPTDVDQIYGDKLSQYKIGGQTAKQFVDGMLTYCYSRAVNTVNAMQTNPASEVGGQLFQLQNQQRAVTTSISSLYNDVSQVYSTAMGSLTGQNYPLNAQACVSGTQQSQINCLHNLQTEMQGLLVGTAPDSGMTIQVRGNNPASYQNVQCKGINGCISVLQNASRNLSTNMASVNTAKSNYILSQNQQFESFAKGVAARVSQESTMLNKQINEINAALTTMGGSPLQVTPIQGQPFQPDAMGLYAPPQNALNAIAQYVQPPLPDMTNSSFLAGSGDATTSINTKYANVNQELMKLQNLYPSCEMQRKQAIINNLTQAGAGAEGCVGTKLCNEKDVQFQNAFIAITNSIASVPSLSGSFGGLNAGNLPACEDPLGPAMRNALNEQEHLPKNKQKSEATLRYELTKNQPSVVAQRGCNNYYSSILNAEKQLEQIDSQSHGSSTSVKGL